MQGKACLHIKRKNKIILVIPAPRIIHYKTILVIPASREDYFVFKRHGKNIFVLNFVLLTSRNTVSRDFPDCAAARAGGFRLRQKLDGPNQTCHQWPHARDVESAMIRSPAAIIIHVMDLKLI